MNTITRYALRWLCKRLVKQGPNHKGNIVAYYRAMYEAAKAEFTEDNKPTLDDFLIECLDEAHGNWFEGGDS